GLDIQQKYKPFYLRPKKFGIMITHGKSDSSQTSSVGSSKLRTNKGKIGVSEKSNMKNESAFSSYLTDLRNRNAESAIPPVKRLKIRTCTTSKIPLPEDIYSSNVCQTFQLEPEVRKTNDFFAMKQSDEKSNPTMSSYENLEESSMSNLTDTDKSVSLFSETLNVNFELGNEIWNDYNDGSFVCNNTNMQELKDPESSPLESKNMCIQNLRKNTSFCQNAQKKPPGALFKSYSPNKTKPDVCLHNSYSPSLTPPSSNKLFLEYGNQNIFRLQEYNLPEKLKMAQLTTTSETTLRSYQVAGKEDFFITNKTMTKGVDLRHQLDDDGDIKPFLGIFDGLF
ncbi:hypothetical protein E2320_022973, partial [Naja naja]